MTGLSDSSIWEIGSAGYIWTYRYMQRRQKDTETDRWMDGTEGLKTRGAVDREKLVREEVRGLVGRGRIKVVGSGRKRGESTVSGEKTNKGKSHAANSLTTYTKLCKAFVLLDMAY